MTTYGMVCDIIMKNYDLTSPNQVPGAGSEIFIINIIIKMIL